MALNWKFLAQGGGDGGGGSNSSTVFCNISIQTVALKAFGKWAVLELSFQMTKTFAREHCRVAFCLLVFILSF